VFTGSFDDWPATIDVDEMAGTLQALLESSFIIARREERIWMVQNQEE
jgi:hypothetical protein